MPEYIAPLKKENLVFHIANNDDDLIDRLNYIFMFTWNLCSCPLFTWWEESAEEGEIGDMKNLFNSFFLSRNSFKCPIFEADSYSLYKENRKKFLIRYNDRKYDLIASMPLNILFYDFEKDFQIAIENSTKKMFCKSRNLKSNSRI